MNSTTPTSPPALELRRRDAEWIDRPDTLAEFGRPAPEPEAARYTGLAEVLVADAIARSHYAIDELADGRVILSCETPRYGIPLGPLDLDRPPTDEWNARDQVSGDLLDAGPDGRIQRSVAMQVRRGLIAVAGALPLIVSPTLAHAGGGPLVHAQLEQLVAFAPPSLPKDAKDQPAPDKQPASDKGAPTEGPTTTAAPTTSAPPAAIPPTTAPPPRVADSLTLTGTALWQGMLGKQVRLDMKSGDTVAGTVVAQSTTDLAVARATDGAVVAVPKAEVASVRMRPETAGSAGGSNVPIGDRPTQDGRGLQTGGVVMVTLGSIAALSGTVMLALSPYYLFISLPLLLPGLAMIGGGSGMIAAASKKEKAYKRAWGITASRVQVTPTLAGGRNGGAAGLILRF